MKKSNEALLKDAPHLDTEGFHAAIEYTSRTTGFRMDLIEKDYFCSIALACLYTHDTPLIFKGGTRPTSRRSFAYIKNISTPTASIPSSPDKLPQKSPVNDTSRPST
jgi:hypothetical protein